MNERVRIGSCAGPADAALVRAMFEGHGIHAVVAGENNAGFGVGSFALDIFVASEDAEQASALLAELQQGIHADALDEHGERGDGSRDDDVEVDDDPTFHERIERRKRTGVVVALGLFITFGTAHMYTRAWLRGIALGALELTGFMRVARDHGAGGAMILGAVVCDLVGSLWRVRKSQRSALLPQATVTTRRRT